jgi:hypothetical protein
VRYDVARRRVVVLALLALHIVLLVGRTYADGAAEPQSSLSDLPVIGLTVVSYEAFARHVTVRNPHIDPIYLRTVYQVYHDECLREHVSLAVALAQMIHETDHLLFTGSVAPTQYNFAGLGVTGFGVAGERFFDIRTGIRAHVQHLKAYGDTAEVVLPIVDPRFRYVQRGSAPTVNALTGRWATDPDYGPKVLAHAHRLMELTGRSSEGRS